MRDGSLICIGKGNVDWNFSAPHGADRIMSSSQAKSSFTLTQFKKTLDECPLAYKPIDEIVKNIGETVEIIDTIIPIYNFKAAE